jgi:MFS family permease
MRGLSGAKLPKISPIAVAVSIGAASSVLSGYDMGVIATAMLTMKPALHLTDSQHELVIGILNLAGAFFGLVGGSYAERIGRRGVICLANVFFFLGSGCIALANGYAMVFVGRLLQGAGVGFALVVVPILVSELVPKERRGELVSLGDVATNFGLLLGYASGIFFLNVEHNWRWMIAVGCAPALVLMGAIWFVSESPRWLVRVGKHERALATLIKICPTEENAHEQLAEIKLAHQASQQNEVDMRARAAKRTRLDKALAQLSAEESQVVEDDPDLSGVMGGSWNTLLCGDDPATRALIWRAFAIAFLSQAQGSVRASRVAARYLSRARGGAT